MLRITFLDSVQTMPERENESGISSFIGRLRKQIAAFKALSTRPNLNIKIINYYYYQLTKMIGS